MTGSSFGQDGIPSASNELQTTQLEEVGINYEHSAIQVFKIVMSGLVIEVEVIILINVACSPTMSQYAGGILPSTSRISYNA